MNSDLEYALNVPYIFVVLIFSTRDQKERKKGLSMTFKPFPVHEDYITVGPTDYGTLPGEQAIQQTKIRYPTIKFGKDYSPDYEPPPFK